MKKLSAFASLALLFAVAACQERPLFSEIKELADGVWTYSDSLAFEVELPDTAQRVDLFIDVRHSSDFFWENCYVRFKTRLPDGQWLGRPISLQLTAPDGGWLGEPSGKTIERAVPVLEKAKFSRPGRYRFVVEQWMRRDSLPGIEAIGLTVRNAK